MRTAQQWGVRPTVMWGKQPGSWSDRDRMLAQALTLFEEQDAASRCAGCGQPRVDCEDPGQADSWDVVGSVRCYSCTALAEASKEYAKAEHPVALRLDLRRKAVGRG